MTGCELTCREQAGTACEGAEFKTGDPTLKAPKVEIEDTRTEVRSTILRTVAR